MPTARPRSPGCVIRMASQATATGLIPSPIADTANAGSRRRSTGLAMTGDRAVRRPAADMAIPSRRRQTVTGGGD